MHIFNKKIIFSSLVVLIASTFELTAAIKDGFYVEGTSSAVFSHQNFEHAIFMPDEDLNPANKNSHQRLGADFGLGLGYWYRLDSSRFVIGPHFHAAYSISNVNYRPDDSQNQKHQIQMPWTLSGSARFGYIISENCLLYGLAGIKTKHLRYTIKDLDNNEAPLARKKQWTYGLMLGAGLEYAINKYQHRIGVEINTTLYNSAKIKGSMDDIPYQSIISNKDLQLKLAYIIPF